MIRTSDKWQDLPAALQAMQAGGLFVKSWRRAEKSTYANLHDVVLEIVEALNTHKIGFTQFVGTIRWGETMNVMSITTRLFTASGEWMEQEGEFPLGMGPVTREGKMVLNPNQAHGSAITYARRYALLSALGMTTGNDDDAQRLDRAVEAAQSTGPQPGNYSEPVDDAAPLDWNPLLDEWRDRPAPDGSGRKLGELDQKQMAEIRKNFYLLDPAVVAEMGDWASIHMDENSIDWQDFSASMNPADGPWPDSFFKCSPAQVRKVFVALKQAATATPK